MLSKNKIKFINSLKVKKYRKKENAFVCEGAKIFDLLVNSGLKILDVFATSEFINNFSSNYSNILFEEVTEHELSKISFLSTPQQVLAVVKIPEIKFTTDFPDDNLTLVLDKIQDPGNLGTIIRIADWFGIKNVVCSDDSVDVYNPKVVQATMGSIFTVNVHYTNLLDYLHKALDKSIPIYGTFMDGKNIYSNELSKKSLIVMGNEANGITSEIEKLISHRISIPAYNKNKAAESLNVAISTSIVCAEFRRRA